MIIEAKSLVQEDLVKQGTLLLIDLPGPSSGKPPVSKLFAERENKVRVKKSLRAFDEMIMHHANPDGPVSFPYEQSILTTLIKPYFEDSCKILGVFCICPSQLDYDSTLITLLFAKRCKKVKLKLIKNSPKQEDMLILTLLKEKNRIIEEIKRLECKIEEHNLCEDDYMQVAEQLINLKKIYKALMLKIVDIDKIDEGVSRKVLKSKETMTLERRILRYSISRASSEFKDDGFLMNLIRVNKSPMHHHKGHEKMTSSESPFEYRQSIDLTKHKQEKDNLLQDFTRSESLLLEKIDSIAQLFDSFDPKQSMLIEDANLLRESFAYLATNEINRDELPLNVQKMIILIEEQDKIIDSLQGKLIEKDDQLDLLQDELKLCRNNISNMQKQLKELKKNRK